MSINVEGKAALITGAGRGICLAFAGKLLEAGCNVVIADLALSAEAEAVMNNFANGTAKAVFIKVSAQGFFVMETTDTNTRLTLRTGTNSRPLSTRLWKPSIASI